MRIIDAVVSMFSTILVAVPALRRVEPAMTSGPTAGAMVRSTKVCSSVCGSQVTKTTREPACRPRVSAPRTEDRVLAAGHDGLDEEGIGAEGGRHLRRFEHAEPPARAGADEHHPAALA